MVFGISIGSTTLSNAVVASGRAQLVANADGHHRPRAVVAKVENEFCVGTAALSARNTPLFKNILKEFIQNGPTHMIQCQVQFIQNNSRFTKQGKQLTFGSFYSY